MLLISWCSLCFIAPSWQIKLCFSKYFQNGPSFLSNQSLNVGNESSSSNGRSSGALQEVSIWKFCVVQPLPHACHGFLEHKYNKVQSGKGRWNACLCRCRFTASERQICTTRVLGTPPYYLKLQTWLYLILYPQLFGCRIILGCFRLRWWIDRRYSKCFVQNCCKNMHSIWRFQLQLLRLGRRGRMAVLCCDTATQAEAAPNQPVDGWP